MNEKERIARELEGMINVVSAARQILTDGRAVDLAGLDNRIGGLCEDVLKLSGEDAVAFRARLIALLDEVDRLTADLEAQRLQLARALGEVATRRHALVAYGKTGPRRK